MRKPGLWNAYRIPALLAALSVAGLVSALLEDGLFDVVSWILLGALVLTMAPALRRRRMGPTEGAASPGIRDPAAPGRTAS